MISSEQQADAISSMGMMRSAYYATPEVDHVSRSSLMRAWEDANLSTLANIKINRGRRAAWTY